MKIKNYEKKSFIMFLTFILIVLEISFVVFLIIYKDYKYAKLNGIVVKESLVILIVTETERKIIYSNSHFLLDSKKIKYEIIEDRGTTIKKEGQDYNELLVKIKFDKNYKVNDIVSLTIRKEKKQLIEMFTTIWGG